MSRGKVLVVEDNKIIALEIKERVEEFGYEVFASVKSGEEALSAVQKTEPDLVLMDIRLSTKMDGIETAQKIRETIDCPVIFLTAYADEVTLQRAKLSQPYGYIVKPLDERELKSAMEIALYKHAAEMKVKASEAKYRAIVETVEGMLFLVDEERNIVFKNRQFEEFTDCKDFENPKCHDVLFERQMPCAHCTMDRVLQGVITRTEVYDNKSDRWFYLINAPVHDPSGKTLNQHLMIDITERKRNEDLLHTMVNEKETMLREIHHRVKNNLQLMKSLVRLQATGSPDENVKYQLRNIENRLSSFALVHETLYSSGNLGKILFSNYVVKLTVHLMQAYGVDPDKIKLDIDVDNIVLPVDLAIPCGIIINELVTNSFKYAYPGDKSGTVKISMHRNGDEYKLAVADDGIGMNGTDPLKCESLGMVIINTISRQLGSEPGFIKSGKGLGFELTLRPERAM